MGTVKYGSVGAPEKDGSDFQMEEKEENTRKDRQSCPFLKDFNPKDKEFWDKVRLISMKICRHIDQLRASFFRRENHQVPRI